MTISNNSFNAPYGVAVDSAGDLWVSDNAQQGSPALYEYTKADLAKPAPSPRLTISIPLNSIGDDTRSGLSFDSSGNLWLVNSAANSLVQFSRSELAKRPETLRSPYRPVHQTASTRQTASPSTPPGTHGWPIRAPIRSWSSRKVSWPSPGRRHRCGPSPAKPRASTTRCPWR